MRMETARKPKNTEKEQKKLIFQLKTQIEFYFSDSNLQKDRFLKQAIQTNPQGFVDVKTIADFNRMKQLTDDIDLVIKAMKSSKKLELNDDESMVKRAAPIPEAKNVDAETIYVEKLPPQADHDWLRKVFSQFGNVAYVSLPRFKHTGAVKGFAFIEFESSKEANEAVQTFHKETEEKENGQNEEQQKPKRRKRSHSESEVDSDKQSGKAEQKRLRTTSESSADSHEGATHIESNQFKKKHPGNEPEPHSKLEELSEESSCVEEDKGRKRKRSEKSVHWKQESDCAIEKASVTKVKEESGSEEKPSKIPKSSESESNTENVDDGDEEKQKKHKKRKRKVKEKKETKLPQLRVISKLEWLRLKEEYKQLQRQSMQNLKKQLQELDGQKSDQQASQKEKTEQVEKEPNKEADKNNPKELPFTPGVVLHFKCVDNELAKKEIRDKITAHTPVAYIDLAEGTGEGYVRFHSADNCLVAYEKLTTDTSAGLELVKVTGEKERDYWNKINTDRVARFQAKREKKRGTEKVARKADAIQVHQQVSHIRFDDAE